MKEYLSKKSNVTISDMTRRKFIAMVSVGAASAITFSFPRDAFAETSKCSRHFTDSLERRNVIAGTIESVTPVGVYAQTIMSTLCPENLASLAISVEEDADDYVDAGLGELSALPETGGISSAATVAVSAEEIDYVNPGLILDVGIPKEGLAEELDALQNETGIPCIFLDASFGNLASVYRTMGTLLGYTDRAEELATYIENIQRRVKEDTGTEKPNCRVFYAPRINGLMVRRGNKVQADAITFVGATPVTSPYDYENQTVNFDALCKEEIDLIVFDDTECLTSLISGSGETYEIWKDVEAITQGRFAISPALIHSWFGSIILAQTLGVLWLATTLWPDACQYDMVSESDAFYSLFYGLSKNEESLSEIVNNHDGAEDIHE